MGLDQFETWELLSGRSRRLPLGAALVGVCWHDEIEHRLAQFFCWAVPVMVWQRCTQAARMAAQSTAMAGAVASSIRQAAMRTMYVVAFTLPPPLGRV